MNRFLSTGKRVVTSSVAVTTILWSIGFASVLPAAAAPMDGDLIKASGNSVYYYMNGGRYTFPNEKTYKTWFQDFKGVKTLSDADLAALPLKGNMAYRPGTYLVKITTDPKTYAVEPGGKLRWIPTEDAAKKWWGSDWNKKVQDVPDAFFPNYMMGDTLGANPPAGYVYKPAGSTSMMLWDGSAARSFASASFAANGYAEKFLQAPAAADASALAKGADVTAKEASLAMAFPATTTTSTTSTTPTAPAAPVGTGLTVALDTDAFAKANPNGLTVAGGSAYITMLALKLTAGSDGDVKVTGLTLTKSGILQDSNLSGVGVYDANGRRHGSIATFGSQKSSLGFSADPILVAKGTSTTLYAKVNIATGVTSGTVAVGAMAAADVATDGAKATGSFPLTGSTFGVVSGTGTIASASLTSQTVAGGTIASPTQIDLGLKGYDVTKFRLQETSGQEDMKLYRLTLYNNGSAADGDYANVTLKDQAGKTVATIANATASKMVFDLSAAPYVISKGQQRDLTVSIDVPGTSNSASRTVNLTVQNDYDVELYGSSTGAGILPTTTQTFPVGDGTGAGDVANAIQFRSGSITLSKSSDSPSGKLAPGSTNVTLCSFDVKAFGEDMELQRITFGVTSDGSAELASNRHALSGTVKINNDLGATVYSASALTTTLYADANLSIGTNNVITNSAAGALTATQVTLNTFYTIKAGTTGKLTFVSDLAQQADSSDAYDCTITGFYSRRVSSNNFVTTTSTVTGNQRQVDVTSLTISSNTAYNPTNMVKGGASLKVGSFNIQAGPAEDVVITSMALTTGTNNSTSTTAAVFTTAAVVAGVSNLSLKAGETTFGTPVSSPTAGSASTFTGSLKVPASGTITMDVYADVSNAFDPWSTGAGTDLIRMQLSVSAAVGQQSQTTVTASAQSGQSITMTTNGTLTLTSSPTDTPIQQVVHAAMVDSQLLALKVSENTNSEDLQLNKLYFAATNGSGNYSDLKLFAGGVQVGQNSQVVNNEIKFTNLNLKVAKGASPTVLWLKGTSTGSGVQTLGQRSFFAPTYYEYSGKSSGTTVRVSGGVIGTASTNDNTDTSVDITVNDASQFSANHRVAIDLNNDGTIAGTNETNNSAGFLIATVTTATNVLTLTAGTTTIADAVDTTLGGRVIAFDTAQANTAGVNGNVNFQSNAMVNHNTEPLVSLANGSLSGTQSPQSGQALATFDVKSDGTRDLRLSSLMFKTSGSYSAGQSTVSFTVAANQAASTLVVNGTTITIADANDNATTEAAAMAVIVNANPVLNKIVTASSTTTTFTLTADKGFSDAFTVTGTGAYAAAANMAFGSNSTTLGGGISGWQLWQNNRDLSAVVNIVNSSGNIQLGAASQNARVNSGNYVQFVLNTPIIVSPGSPSQLVVKANTSNVKSGVTSGTVTAGIFLDGSAGAGQYLGGALAQITGNTLGGVRWDYVDVNNLYGSSNGTAPSAVTITVSTAPATTDFYTILAHGQSVNSGNPSANTAIAGATAIVTAWNANATLAAQATAANAAGTSAVVTLTPLAGSNIASPFVTIYDQAASGLADGSSVQTVTGGMMDVMDNYQVYGNTVTY